MTIEWFGQACCRLTTISGPNREMTVIFDPFDPAKIGLKLPRLSGDIVAVTHEHPDHNYTAGVSGDYVLVRGPGEYEVKQTRIYGIPGWHDNKGGTERGPNTMYVLKSEGLTVAHLGDLGQTELTDTQLEQLERVDIVMIPVGGVYTVDGRQAAEIINQIEPHVVIPMHFNLPGLRFKLDGVDKFLDAMGANSQPPEDKFTISKNDLLVGGTRVVVLRV